MCIYLLSFWNVSARLFMYVNSDRENDNNLKFKNFLNEKLCWSSNQEKVPFSFVEGVLKCFEHLDIQKRIVLNLKLKYKKGLINDNTADLLMFVKKWVIFVDLSNSMSSHKY